MEIALYQINLARDKYGVAFKNYQHVEFYINTTGEFDGSIYDKVFHGTVDCKTLDEIYNLFSNPPDNYKGRSIAISDVIEVIGRKSNSKFYYVDYLNYMQIDFSSEKALTRENIVETSNNKIKVLLVEPNDFPKVIEIENTLEEIQRLVGGEVQVLTPYKDEIAIICNKNKVNFDAPLNRVIYAEPEKTEMSYTKLKAAFRRQHQKKASSEHLCFRIVFTEDSFKRPYTEHQRTFHLEHLQQQENNYSIRAVTLGNDCKHIDLGRYMKAELGGKDGWKVEKCYTFSDPKAVDIIHGSFLIVGCSNNSNEYISLSMNCILKYNRLFHFCNRYRPPLILPGLAVEFYTPTPRKFLLKN